MELIPGRIPADEAAREEWGKAGARSRLAAVRIRRCVRQEDLAAAIGISIATLRRIESGQNGSGVPVWILLAAAQSLEVPFTTLIEDDWLDAAARTKGADRQPHLSTHLSEHFHLPDP